MEAAQIKQKLWPLLQRTFNRELEQKNYSTQEIAEWDSLNHINLMFAIEGEFNVMLTPEEIGMLFSDTDTVTTFLSSKVNG